MDKIRSYNLVYHTLLVLSLVAALSACESNSSQIRKKAAEALQQNPHSPAYLKDSLYIVLSSSDGSPQEFHLDGQKYIIINDPTQTFNGTVDEESGAIMLNTYQLDASYEQYKKDCKNLSIVPQASVFFDYVCADQERTHTQDDDLYNKTTWEAVMKEEIRGDQKSCELAGGHRVLYRLPTIYNSGSPVSSAGISKGYEALMSAYRKLVNEYIRTWGWPQYKNEHQLSYDSWTSYVNAQKAETGERYAAYNSLLGLDGANRVAQQISKMSIDQIYTLGTK